MFLPFLPNFFFFFNDPAPTEIYTLSLHDALPISRRPHLPEEKTGAHPLLRLSRGEQQRFPPGETPAGSQVLDRGTVAPQLRDGLQTGGPRQLRREPPPVHAARARGGRQPLPQRRQAIRVQGRPGLENARKWGKRAEAGQELVIPAALRKQDDTGNAMPCVFMA